MNERKSTNLLLNSYVTRILRIGSRTRIGRVSNTDTRPIRLQYVSNTPAGISTYVAYPTPPNTVSNMALTCLDTNLKLLDTAQIRVWRTYTSGVVMLKCIYYLLSLLLLF